MKTPFVLMISLAIAGAAAYALWQGMPERAEFAPPVQAKTQADTSVSQLAIGGAFSLVDTESRPVTDKDLRGSFALVYFGFTSCPDMCPTTLQAMTVALNKLGPLAEKVRPVFITVDPEHDTPAVMKDYIKNFHPRMWGLTGTKEQTDAAAESYRVFHKKVQKPGEEGETVDHSGFIYLISPAGEYVTHFPPNEEAEKMMVELTKYLR